MGAEIELQIGDARAALAFAAEVAECAGEAELTSRIEALPDLIGADGVIVTAGREWMGEMTMEVGDPGLYSPDLMAAVEREWRDHPLVSADLFAAAAESARRLSDRVPQRGWRRSGLFNDFYRPLGLPHELSAQIDWGPHGCSCCVALHRSGSDFDARELALLATVTPHLRAARARIAGRPPAAVEGAPSPGALARRLPITPREAEVLARLAAGRTNAGIALDLGISPHTVVRHVEHIYAKLDVHTRTAATRLALGASLDEV